MQGKETKEDSFSSSHKHLTVSIVQAFHSIHTSIRGAHDTSIVPWMIILTFFFLETLEGRTIWRYSLSAVSPAPMMQAVNWLSDCVFNYVNTLATHICATAPSPCGSVHRHRGDTYTQSHCEGTSYLLLLIFLRLTYGYNFPTTDVKDNAKFRSILSQ